MSAQDPLQAQELYVQLRRHRVSTSFQPSFTRSQQRIQKLHGAQRGHSTHTQKLHASRPLNGLRS